MGAVELAVNVILPLLGNFGVGLGLSLPSLL